MKRIFTSTVLFALIVAISATFPFHSTSAHVLQTDGSMGAVLHIDPNDAPVAQQPATFFIDIANKNGAFNLNDCTCTAVLTAASNGSTIAQPTILPETGQPSEGTFEYLFKDSAVYTLTVQGTPKANGAFQNFTLRYNFQVEPAQNAAGAQRTGFAGFIHSEHGLHYILFGAGFIVILFLFFNEYKRKPESKDIKK
jgi:hypothetical protein